MRWLLLFALAGCIAEPGLGSSPTDCPVSEPVGAGFLVNISSPDRFVGHCMEVAHDDESIDDPFAARLVPADGQVYLPVDGPGRYYLSVQVEDEDDPYCAAHVGEFVQHDGTGIVVVDAEVAYLCS